MEQRVKYVANEDQRRIIEVQYNEAIEEGGLNPETCQGEILAYIIKELIMFYSPEFKTMKELVLAAEEWVRHNQWLQWMDNEFKNSAGLLSTLDGICESARKFFEIEEDSDEYEELVDNWNFVFAKYEDLYSII